MTLLAVRDRLVGSTSRDSGRQFITQPAFPRLPPLALSTHQLCLNMTGHRCARLDNIPPTKTSGVCPTHRKSSETPEEIGLGCKGVVYSRRTTYLSTCRTPSRCSQHVRSWWRRSHYGWNLLIFELRRNYGRSVSCGQLSKSSLMLRAPKHVCMQLPDPTSLRDRTKMHATAHR